MSLDLSPILSDWDYDPDRVLARIVTAPDGRELVQMRIDLGLLQMERDGRPDGLRPEGHESWLEYYEALAAAPLADADPPRRFTLSEEDNQRLMREGVQYYHRYLCFWHLKRYELCARDTRRNLRLFAFVVKHAPTKEQRLAFDQYRPYVTMMHARAVAMPLVDLRQYDAALEVIDSGIRAIQDFLREYRQTHRARQCAELWQLERFREQVVSQRDEDTDPRSLRLAELQRQLHQAVAEERFEDAARLRDEIRTLIEP